MATSDVLAQSAATSEPAGHDEALSAAIHATRQTRNVRVTAQPGFVLHSYPYRETSLIIDVLTRDHGRIALVAKGAKRPHSALRGVLQTFQPLSLSWSGKSELRTLIRAEWVGGRAVHRIGAGSGAQWGCLAS